MHPDLFLTVYRQHERELEQHLLQRYAAEERAASGPRRQRSRRAVHLRLHRKGSAGA
ncbi:MAG TPA: hypothetical protein VGK35_00685 [Actinotalea sp.]|jgi:hypothetical protein